MDASARRSFPHVHTLFALTVFACLAFAPFSHAAHTPFARRDMLLPRQNTLTLTTTTTTTTSSISTLLSTRVLGAPSSSSAISSSSAPLSPSPSPSPLFNSFSSLPSSSTSLSSTFSLSQSSITSQALSLVPVPSTRPNTTPAQSTARSTQPVELTPSITFAITNNFLPTQSTETSSVSTEPSTTDAATSDGVSAAAQSGFWRNKGVVAAVFVIVSLSIVGVGIILIIVLLKRRNMRRPARLHDEIFETYTEPDFRSNSPGPSINAAPMDAFARREIGYNNLAPSLNTNLQSQPRIAIPTSPIQHPDYYDAPSRYTPPSQMQPATPSARPPRNPEVRGSTGYQPSLDSFYGAGSPTADRPQP